MTVIERRSSFNHHMTARAIAAAIAGTVACSPSAKPRAESVATAAADSFGVVPLHSRVVRVRSRPELVESSGLTASVSQPGILFTINDSGNEPVLFALDTTGADRGAWRISGATDVDWESVAVGPCGSVAGTSGPAAACIYIGDTGDNDSVHQTRVVYRVAEPRAESPGFLDSLSAERLTYRYADGPRDVEAMYVAPGGAINLITKRSNRDAAGALRPALIYVVDAAAWRSPDVAVARLGDSLAFIPTPTPLRQATDAALSPDARYLAVRTYIQIYIFATDPHAGTVRRAIPPALCNVSGLEERVGEGIAWLAGRELVLMSEGRNEPLHIVQCPLPPS